jgi:hypothetical protein
LIQRRQEAYRIRRDPEDERSATTTYGTVAFPNMVDVRLNLETSNATMTFA